MAKFFKWTFWTFVILLVLSMAVGTLAIGTAFDGWQDSGHWHVVVVDECHRLAADRFDAFVTAVKPRLLL